jgi:shikimate dehydrogenase
VRFGVVGDPVSHSRSPAIHRAGFAAAGLDASYDFLPTPPDGFATIVERLRHGDLDGVNVTMPHKEHAFEAADRVSASAARTTSVNTIVRQDGDLVGYNTDVDGVRHAHHIVGAPSSPVLVLGTGGAARAALVALEHLDITVAARRPASAQMASASTGVDAAVVRWGVGIPGALVVNATPVGMHGEALPMEVLDQASAIIDMAYGHGVTPAIAWARDHDRPFADGLDMLVGQAARAFTHFTGHQPPLEAMISAARG